MSAALIFLDLDLSQFRLRAPFHIGTRNLSGKALHRGAVLGTRKKIPSFHDSRMGATRTNFHRRCSPLSSLLPAFHFSLPRCTVLGRSHSFMGASNGSSRAGNISSNVTMAFDPRNRPAPTLRDRNLRGTIGAPFERRLLHSRSSPFCLAPHFGGRFSSTCLLLRERYKHQERGRHAHPACA